MRVQPSAKKRLQRLNNAQSGRPWQSVTEKRRCIVCERAFRGKDVRMRWSRPGVVQLTCPTPECESGPAAWVRLGNPLMNAAVWSEWEAAITAAADQQQRHGA
jgi:hypothetical protein